MLVNISNSASLTLAKLSQIATSLLQPANQISFASINKLTSSPDCILTEDNSLDSEILDFLLVSPSPPVNVFGQSVCKKFGHYPPDTLLARHPSIQSQEGDLESAN